MCEEELGNDAQALGYYERFLASWSMPDAAFPEIADALVRYQSLTGEDYALMIAELAAALV